MAKHRVAGAGDDGTGHDGEIWLSKEDAAALAGVKVRQLERRAAEGRIQKRILPRAPSEKAARVVYSQRDVEAMRGGAGQLQVVPGDREIERSIASGGFLATRPISRAVSNDAGRAIAGSAGAEFWAALTERLAPPRFRLWLTLDEAVEYSGLPRGWLLEHARSGAAFAIDVATGGDRARWRFNRELLGLVTPAGAE